jgi:hypothetical protein
MPNDFFMAVVILLTTVLPAQSLSYENTTNMPFVVYFLQDALINNQLDVYVSPIDMYTYPDQKFIQENRTASSPQLLILSKKVPREITVEYSKILDINTVGSIEKLHMYSFYTLAWIPIQNYTDSDLTIRTTVTRDDFISADGVTSVVVIASFLSPSEWDIEKELHNVWVKVTNTPLYILISVAVLFLCIISHKRLKHLLCSNVDNRQNRYWC